MDAQLQYVGMAPKQHRKQIGRRKSRTVKEAQEHKLLGVPGFLLSHIQRVKGAVF